MIQRLRNAWLALRGDLQPERAREAIKLVTEFERQNVTLTRMLRDLDQRIFNLSQATNQAEMQKVLGPLVDEMMLRKNKEHKRITSILVPELERTYGRE